MHARTHRLNDAEMHWNSLCKLLAETLIRLEATYAELRHILKIRDEEFDWLSRAETACTVRRSARGDLDIVREEIATHSVSGYSSTVCPYRAYTYMYLHIIIQCTCTCTCMYTCTCVLYMYFS